MVGKRTYSTKEAIFFHFEGGSTWRVPSFPKFVKHYEWSREFSLSSEGLYNTSLKGNEFYFVAIQGASEVTYIYPCKFFELSEQLKK